MKKYLFFVFLLILVVFIFKTTGLTANLQKVFASADNGSIAYSASQNNSGDTYSFALVGGPANTSGTLNKQSGSGGWTATSNWIKTDSSGNANKGPWTCSGGADDPAVTVYISWPDGSQTNSVSHHCNYSTGGQTTTASGNGSVVLNIQICQTLGNFQSPSGQTCSGTPTSPSNDIAGQFKYDVERLVGSGTNTQITTVLSGVGAGTYSLPANTPNAGNNNRDNYSVIEKSAPTNYDLIGTSGFTYPYNFSVTSGQSVTVDLPYVIYQAIEQTAPSETTISADIVDGNGNFVRTLSTSETNSVTFDIQHSVTSRGEGGAVGSHSNNFDTQVSGGKLNTSYSLTTYIHSGSILTNIIPPSGFVVRSIDPGTYFGPTNTSNVTIHFTQAPASSLTQKADQMLYVPSGISYVKKIAQTYSDNEYKYSDLDVDLFAYNGNNNRPFPLNWSISKYSGVPYLFMNAVGKIVVYDISDPANPKQVSEFLLSNIQDFNEITHHTGAGDKVYGPCSPENLGTHAFITSADEIFTSDNSPYILVNVGHDYAVKGTAIFSLDPGTMQITAYPKWTMCYSVQGGYGMYKGSDGKTYFVSQPFDSSVESGNIASILYINSAGVITNVKTLSSSNGSGTSGAASDINYRTASLFTSGGKTYLIGLGKSVYGSNSVPIYIYDISNPSNITKINQQISPLSFLGGISQIKIDNQGKRMYLSSSIPNPSYSATSTIGVKDIPIWQIYDLSVLPSAPKLIATYNKPTDLLNSTQVSADFAQVAKRLGITSTGNIIDISNSSFIYGGYGFSSSAQLINVSNNLAYVSLYTNGKSQWDLIANQAGVTDQSEYGTNAIQFIVDLTNATQPKILGMIFGHTEYSAYGLTAGGWFDVPLYGSIINHNGYIYRANFRIADEWKLGNAPAPSGNSNSTTNTITTHSISQPTLQNLQQSLFSFQNLLNIFKQLLNKQ